VYLQLVQRVAVKNYDRINVLCSASKFSRSASHMTQIIGPSDIE